MGKRKELKDQKFNRLTVIEEDGRNKDNSVMWKCECECGSFTRVASYSLTSGRTKSCGCLKLDMSKKKTYFKHGLSNTRTYNIWHAMKERCNNKNYSKYQGYGSRSIKVCDEWLDEDQGFINFHRWALINGYEESLSLDRIDNDGNYEPSNCRWATSEQQARNRRGNLVINHKGLDKTLAEWCDIYGILGTTVNERIKRGWSIDKALTATTRDGYMSRSRRVICITTGLEFDSAKEAGDFYKIDRSSIGKSCRGKVQYCGKLKDGTPLKWEYLL